MAVAVCVSMTVVIGGTVAGAVNGLVLTVAGLAFLFDLGEEVASDAMDVEGDSVRSSRSIAATAGRAQALRLPGAAFALFVALTSLPCAAAGLCMSYLAPRLVRSTTIAEGRVFVRRLYLAWGAFVVLFALASLL